MAANLRSLSADLSHSWSRLGRVLASRRLAASLHGPVGRLTPSKLRALDVLAEAGSIRTSDLARRIGVDETTATRLVDRLEQLELVERGRSDADRRVTLVSLAASGRETVAAIAEQRRRFFADVLAALEPEERLQLVRLTEKAAALLETQTEELVSR
jgi:DNA-binding MarR family transcriptional regulator